MANNIWQGADGNWDTVTNWSLGTKAAAGEDIFLTDSSQDISSGHTNEDAVALASLRVDRTYTGKVGQTGSSLTIDVTGTMWIYSGGAEFWWSGDCPTIYVNTAGIGSNACVLDCQGVDTNDLYVEGGRCTLPGTATVVNAHVVGSGSRLVTVNGLTLTTLNLRHGSVDNAASFTTANVDAGQINHTAGTGATLNLNGGTCVWTGGLLTNIYVNKGGYLDASGLKAPLASDPTIYIGDGARVNLRTGMNLLQDAVLNVVGKPSQLLVDSGSTWT